MLYVSVEDTGIGIRQEDIEKLFDSFIRLDETKNILLRRAKNILDSIDKIHGLTEAANLDLMTGLLNKTATQKEISKLCEKSQGVLMILDLDNFKLVNDLYGHGTGDDMQILPGTSIGAVFVPKESRDFSTPADKVDKAFYKVKHRGKHGCAFFGEETLTNAAEHKSLSQPQMILSERSREADAYFVDFDKFKAIYQFTARMNLATQFPEKTFETDNDEAREEFLELLIKNLRRSDCVTQYGRDQILAMLNDRPTGNVDAVRRKILAALLEKNLGGEITFEAGEVSIDN